jgi:hypothetical protein
MQFSWLREEMHRAFCLGKLKGKDYPEYGDIDGRILLE